MSDDDRTDGLEEEIDEDEAFNSEDERKYGDLFTANTQVSSRGRLQTNVCAA